MRVLIVEDETNTRLAMVQLLEALGHEPQGCENARDAMASCNDGPVDLLITDWLLKGEMDGVQLASWYRTQFPGQPVVLMTGQSRGELAEVSSDLGDVVCLFKPYGITELTGAIESACGN